MCGLPDEAGPKECDAEARRLAHQDPCVVADGMRRTLDERGAELPDAGGMLETRGRDARSKAPV